MAAITKNLMNDYHGLAIQDRDLQKNQATLSLGQSSTWTCCQPSWVETITKNVKRDYHGSMMVFGVYCMSLLNGGALLN